MASTGNSDQTVATKPTQPVARLTKPTKRDGEARRGAESAAIESFSDGETLEFPQYTRPEEFQGMKVPDVLLSGHHGAIAQWRKDNSFKAE